ncbi:VOC family protein [Halocynthiibacter sp. C4]|uniref:VOC family protein n=1 Tax=Halocynthiibacter sp. C4 TaxID=2992758 RepID=UPI00237A4C07|nr:VOC family protein [Halocynthiibacter sp. C4]MDE0591574.1 VOC family protein [Halocynthiibacter sp. C4]
MSQIPPIKIIHAALPVSDMATARSFYIKLGLKPKFERHDPDTGEHLLQLACSDGSFVELIRTSEKQPHPQCQHLGFQVSDIHTAHEALSKSGIPPQTEPNRGASGVDWFFVSDPDGNQLEFTSKVTAE